MKTFQYQGGCHCGDVRFNLKIQEAIDQQDITACNCSMCEKLAYLHLIIPKNKFELTSSKDNLSLYQFNKKIAKHYFCKKCGVKSFYQPRSHPDCWSVNVRCLDNFSQYQLKLQNFDGKNWEQNIQSIT